MRIATALALTAAAAAPAHAGEQPCILESAAKLAAETRLEPQQIQRTEPERRRPARPALPWIFGSAIVGGLIAAVVLKGGDAPDTLQQGDPEPLRLWPF